MSKILALCSGGFDSVLMLNYIRTFSKDDEITTLFFDYGQKNVKKERFCAKKVSRKLDCKYMEIRLPKFIWTSSEFYNQGFSGDKEELEARNLVFMSFALSVCISQGIDTMYMAVLKSLGYYDTSEDFLSKIRGIFSDNGISIETPFSDVYKEELDLLAFELGISPDDFFSCDNPVHGKPCGECPDCKILQDIMNHASLNTPAKVWAKTFDPEDERFQNLIRTSPITEMRVLVNNDCQLHCKHCYYGFDSMKEPRLSLDEFKRVFEQAKELGIGEYHFSGKEPMYDDFMFEVADVLKQVIPFADLTVVTNGITVPKYAEKLKQYGFSKVFLSVDDVGDSSFYRSVSNVTDKALTALNEVGIPVQVFIDLHERNFDKVDSIMDFLHTKYGVKEFYVRTLSLIGNAVENGIRVLTGEELNTTHSLILKYSSENPDVEVRFTLMAPYVYDLLFSEAHTELKDCVDRLITLGTLHLTDNYSIFPETYCGKYESQITLTPDGFIHGCASEVSNREYDKLSPGNVRTTPLKDLIKSGKEMCIKSNLREIDSEGNLLFFNCTSCNPID